MKQKVTIANDLVAIALPPGLSLHNYLGPVPPLPTAPVSSPMSAAAEFPVPVFFPPGVAGHRLSRRVLHKKKPIALDGHDCGRGIPHLHGVPSPANALTVVHILFSSRRAMFFSSRVRIENLYVASCDGTAFPPTPMMSCSDPANVPAAFSVTSVMNRVVFGMRGLDFAAGWIAVAASIGADLLLVRISRAKAKRVPTLDELFDMLWPDANKELRRAVIGAAFGKPEKWIVKSCAAAASGVARIALSDGPFRMTLVTSGSKGVFSGEVAQDGRGQRSHDVDADLPSTAWPTSNSHDPATWGDPL